MVLVLCFVSCQRDEVVGEGVEASDDLYDFLEGRWVIGGEDERSAANSQRWIRFENSTKALFLSEDFEASYEVLDYESKEGGRFYIEISYEDEASEADPFGDGEEGEMVMRKVFFSVTKHAVDCIEIDFELAKMRSSFYYRDAGDGK